MVPFRSRSSLGWQQVWETPTGTGVSSIAESESNTAVFESMSDIYGQQVLPLLIDNLTDNLNLTILQPRP